jgi:hypothetical protein
VRSLVYAVLAAGLVLGVVLVRGIVRGERNRLVTSVLQSDWVRGFVERQFRVRYSLAELHIVPGCGVEAARLTVAVPGASAAVARLRICTSGVGEAEGIEIGQALGLRSLRFDWPRWSEGAAFAWHDATGEIVTADRFTTLQPGPRLEVETLRVLDFATVKSVAGDLAARSGTVRGVNLIVDRNALAQAPPRLQAAASALAGMASAALPFPPQWSVAARRLLTRLVIAAALVLLVVKFLLTPGPGRVIVLVPFGSLFRLRAAWYQRLEPAAMDVLLLLLILPVRLLLAWPPVATPSLPVVNEIAIAQLDIHNAVAIVREPQCGQGDIARVQVYQAGVSNARLELSGFEARRVEVERGWASGTVDPLTFTAEYASRRAGFSVEWPESFAAKGTADLEGARIEDLHTLSGAPVRIAKAAADVRWPNAISGRAQLQGIEAAGARVEAASATFEVSPPCRETALDATVALKHARYGDLAIESGTVEVARPDSKRIGVTGTLANLALAGRISASARKADFSVAGATSGELVPSKFDGAAMVSADRIATKPVRFSADLATGDFQVPRQAIEVTQDVTSRLARSLDVTVQASRSGAEILIPKLVPDLGPASVVLNDVRIETVPFRLSSGWSIASVPELPGRFSVRSVSNVRLSTAGEILSAPAALARLPELPAIPRETKFRFEGTAQSVKVFTDGEPIIIENIETPAFALSFPELRLESLVAETRATVKRGGGQWPLAARTRLTDAAIDTALSAPIAGELRTSASAVEFALTSPQGPLSALRGKASFAGDRLGAFDVEGSLGAGRVAAGSNFEISQNAPSSFHISAASPQGATAVIRAPSVNVSVNGGQQRARVSAEGTVDIAFAPAPPSAVFGRLGDAAAGLRKHVENAVRVFGDSSASNYPVRWDLDLSGGAVLKADKPALDAKAVIRSLDIGRNTIDGTLDLKTDAALADDFLWLNVRGPVDIGALGRRWKLNTPVQLALRKELVGQAFSLPTIAIGYGDVLQARTALSGQVFHANAGAALQAAIRWLPTAASIDSLLDLNFRGLEAGAIQLPRALLEDRLDGTLRLATKGFLLEPNLLASVTRSLDSVDLSLNIHGAKDRAPLRGIFQAATSLDLKPADELIRLLTGKLRLTFPPRALSYRDLTLDFQVRQGRILTDQPLLTLQGAQMLGVTGLTVDSNLRVMWGSPPAPMLRDLVYSVQGVVGQ